LSICLLCMRTACRFTCMITSLPPFRSGHVLCVYHKVNSGFYLQDLRTY
jgi:hypothetical protein